MPKLGCELKSQEIMMYTCHKSLIDVSHSAGGGVFNRIVVVVVIFIRGPESIYDM